MIKMRLICLISIFQTIIIILGIFVQSNESLRLDSSYNGNYTLRRVKRQPNPCRGSDKNQFQCEDSWQCIDNDQECNGVVDCPDGSDETKEFCENIICPGYLFRCDYGGCISGHFKCDGKQDCRDNSDEANCVENNNCRSNQYQCSNGECIDIYGRCNGIIDCKDGTDETEALCLNINCPGNTFKCKYGACVDGTAKCNGIKECHDNSDEDPSVCSVTTSKPAITIATPPPRINGPTCTTPAQPSNGFWKYWNGRIINKIALANKRVDPITQIIFKCNNGTHQLSTSHDRDQEIFYCQENGEWSNGQIVSFGFPKCLVLCEKYYSSDHAVLQCKRDNSVIPCDRATHNTILTFTCDPYYESASLSTTNYCTNGVWTYERPKCKEVCGEKRVSAQPLIIGGKEVEHGLYPWVVALYMFSSDSATLELKCGGSLLTVNLILTAAHCVSNGNTGEPFDKEVYRVAAGKYFNKYNDSKDLDRAQYRKISRFIKHDEFRGADSQFRSDIAILKVDKEFFLSRVIQPVCYRNLPGLTDIGDATFTGWGFTKTSSEPSDVLKEIGLQYVQPSTCLKKYIDDEFYRRYLFGSDKICGESINGTGGACQGDSGGGLVVSQNDGRYFIQGILSLNRPVMQSEGQHCSTGKPVLFTFVKKYKSWIDETMALLEGQE